MKDFDDEFHDGDEEAEESGTEAAPEDEAPYLDSLNSVEYGEGAETGYEGPEEEPFDGGDSPLEDPLDIGRGEDVEAPRREEDGREAVTAPAFDSRQHDEDDLKPFSPSKVPVTEVIKNRPKTLNKQFIIAAAVSVFAAAVIFATFVAPALNIDIKKPLKQDKPVPVPNEPPDYSALVPRERPQGPSSPEEPEYPEETDITGYFYRGDGAPGAAPVDERFTNQNRPPYSPPSGGGGGGGPSYTLPDTRNDRLQARAISGIKGITPTQQQYLTAPGTPYAPYQNAPQGYVPGDSDNPYARFGMPNREDYIAQVMSQANATSYSQQNDQSGKMNFYSTGRENSGAGYFLPPASIWQGTMIEAALTSAINTDLPGECTAVVTRNIYSSQDGRFLLIPQNSKLLGTYNSSVSYSQKRVQVGWHTLIRPDGYYVNLGNMQAADPRGAAGLPGAVNEHFFQWLKAIGLLSVMNIVNGELGYNMASTDNQYVQNIMANTQQVTSTVGARIIDRALDVQPTITIKEGTRINIVANSNLVLPPVPSYPVTYPYRRGQ
jgi:type IV secretion system protein VirB10